MTDQLQPLHFVEPVKTLSAKEIAAMPYSETMAQLEVQETHYTKERSVGGTANKILQSLRQGGGSDHAINGKTLFLFS